MMTRMMCAFGVFAIALVLFVFAAVCQAYEEKAEAEAKLRRWEKKVNAIYRDDPDAALGRV